MTEIRGGVGGSVWVQDRLLSSYFGDFENLVLMMSFLLPGARFSTTGFRGCGCL